MAILIVDDIPVNLLLLEEMLRQEGYADIHCARSGREALEMLATAAGGGAGEKGIDLILMDVMMPGMDGIEACRRIKAQDGLRDIPVIMVTVRDDDEALAQAFAMGATDYIVKPFKEVELLARVRAALKFKRETDRRKALEQELVVLTRQLETMSRRLPHLAPKDLLPGEANRCSPDEPLPDRDLLRFQQILGREWNRTRREAIPLSLLMVKLDDLEGASETPGPDKGDGGLREVAALLNGALKRAGDTVVRYEGEEFAAILPGTPNGGALAVAQEILAQTVALAGRYGARSGETLTASIGLATAEPCRGPDMQRLITAAEEALSLARGEGGNRVKVAADCR